jgi:hypothetical protein
MDGTGSAVARTPARYLSVCSMFRHHSLPGAVRDLCEWIEFHRLVGAEHFFLYGDKRAADRESVLSAYIDGGVVTLHDWPVFPGLIEAFDDCLERHRHDSYWIAFMDLDEFLFSPQGGLVSDVLRDFEDAPGVGINRVPFGTSGHVSRPEGLVIESYLRCATLVNNAIKSIVHPPAAERSLGGHHFAYHDGRMAVDELHRPLDPARRLGRRKRSGAAFTQTFSAERLRINHYITKSLEEYEAKMALPRPDTGGTRRVPNVEWQLERMDARRDETILRYAPQLREALRTPAAPVASADPTGTA